MLKSETICEGLYSVHPPNLCHWQFNYNSIVRAILNVRLTDWYHLTVKSALYFSAAIAMHTTHRIQFNSIHFNWNFQSTAAHTHRERDTDPFIRFAKRWIFIKGSKGAIANTILSMLHLAPSFPFNLQTIAISFYPLRNGTIHFCI